MITLHYLNNSRSLRILWLLEELNLAYKLVRYKRDPQTSQAPHELQILHPLAVAPVIEDDGLVLAESGVIISYLLSRYDEMHTFWPEVNSLKWSEYLYWLHYAEGSLMPVLTQKLLFKRLNQPPVPWVLRAIAGLISQGVQNRRINPQLERHKNFITQHLSQCVWFVGDKLTGADIQMSYALEALCARTEVSSNNPIYTFLKRIYIRPAYQQALEKSGGFNILA